MPALPPIAAVGPSLPLPKELTVKERVLQCVVDLGEATCEEVEKRMGGHVHQSVSARLKELKREGFVRLAGTRPTESGREAEVWRATTEEERAASEEERREEERKAKLKSRLAKIVEALGPSVCESVISMLEGVAVGSTDTLHAAEVWLAEVAAGRAQVHELTGDAIDLLQRFRQHQNAHPGQDWTDVSQLAQGVEQQAALASLTALTLWSVVEPNPVISDEWRLTQKGYLFVAGDCLLPTRLLVFHGKVVASGGQSVHGGRP